MIMINNMYNYGINFVGMQNNIVPGMNFQPNLIANPLQNNPNLIQPYNSILNSEHSIYASEIIF